MSAVDAGLPPLLPLAGFEIVNIKKVAKFFVLGAQIMDVVFPRTHMNGHAIDNFEAIPCQANQLRGLFVIRRTRLTPKRTSIWAPMP